MNMLMNFISPKTRYTVLPTSEDGIMLRSFVLSILACDGWTALRHAVKTITAVCGHSRASVTGPLSASLGVQRIRDVYLLFQFLPFLHSSTEFHRNRSVNLKFL